MDFASHPKECQLISFEFECVVKVIFFGLANADPDNLFLPMFPRHVLVEPVKKLVLELPLHALRSNLADLLIVSFILEAFHAPLFNIEGKF